jgi:hypothetical protein
VYTLSAAQYGEIRKVGVIVFTHTEMIFALVVYYPPRAEFMLRRRHLKAVFFSLLIVDFSFLHGRETVSEM